MAPGPPRPARPSATQCRLAIVRPLTGLARREGGPAAGRRDRRDRRHVARRASRSTRPGARSAARRTRRSRSRSCAGTGAPFDVRDRARRHRPARGRDQRPRRRQGRPTSSSPGSPIGRPPTSTRRSRRPSQRGQKQLVVDLRGNPGGLVTAARDIASQFLADGTIFWEEDGQGNLTETTAKPGGAATDPSIQRRAARGRRVRVGVRDRRRARSTTGAARSSSGARRSARARSSSGPSSRTTAAGSASRSPSG